MPYILFYPGRAPLTKAGFGLVSEIPVIFDENWKYHRVASRYLRARANGEVILEEDGGTSRFPTKQSMETFGRALTDFLEWCTWAKCSWQKVMYKRDLVERYQQHMLDGSWSAHGQPLAARTVNRRVDEACYFLRWAARNELRPSFDMPFAVSYRAIGGLTSHSHKHATVKKRTGRVREDPLDLNIPAAQQVEEWLKCVTLQKGSTKALMCDLVIETGLRREECAQWRISYLPLDRSRWRITGTTVTVKIEYGTKGPKHAKADEEVGPSRFISLSLEFAERLCHYLEFVRPKIAMKYINAVKDPSERRRRLKQIQQEDRLFLSEYDGRPITGDTLHKAWTLVRIKPYKGWSPHLGRHYYVCMRLLRSIRLQQKLLAQDVRITNDWIVATGSSELLLLTKQLGHIDQKTINAYLVWLTQAAGPIEDSDHYLDMNQD